LPLAANANAQVITFRQLKRGFYATGLKVHFLEIEEEVGKKIILVCTMYPERCLSI